jgi:hypothetical protein
VWAAEIKRSKSLYLLLRVSNAYAEAPRGIQQVRYREKYDSELSPLGSIRTPCQALQHRPLPVLTHKGTALHITPRSPPSFALVPL